ncbi:MAG: VWA domain-containing protein [Acidobacteriaceae bacterium]
MNLIPERAYRIARALGFAGLLTATLSLAQQAPAHSSSGVPTINVNVHLIDVFASVTDPSGAPVGSLSRKDFALFENGKAQKIAVFERDTSAPIAVALAIDTSGSVRKDLAEEQQAARHFVHATLRPQDRIDLLQFSDSVREVSGFTSSERQIGNGIASLQGGAGTAFYSGVLLASQLLRPQLGRRVLVVISDGDNTVKGTSYAEALEEAVRDEVMIYSIIEVPIEASAGRDLAGEHALISLAEGTGGRYFYAASAPLEQIFRRISDDLRTQYLLGYYPATTTEEDESFRSIAVKLQDVADSAKYTVRHRPGYYPSGHAQ